ncbi:MAG TPA: methyltransferase domain-containing protein [Gemmatimonadaceae bacterium]|nr:methyltransferase domain-containing protein [Gemmatimonadaceae bacterium]
MSRAMPYYRAWADVPAAQVEKLISESRRVGWRAALGDAAVGAPFFGERLGNLRLANWHLLLARSPSGAALDMGCGFGTLPLGLADHFRTTVGAEMLPERLRYASLRARQEPWPNAHFVRSHAAHLPLADASFDLVTMNGVLEWAALYSDGDPRSLQLAMLAEARRVSRGDGMVAVAIENRYALESLLALSDTHTGLTFVTAMPRGAADLMSRLRRHEPYRVFLYSQREYKQLFHEAGFTDVTLLDLVSSYNDYDFVVRPDDALTYRFLWKRRMVRSFYRPAAWARKRIARWKPALLGKLSYAYLVVGGQCATTLLDEQHPFWSVAAAWGADPGRARFASPGNRPGAATIFTHNGKRILSLLELGPAPDGISNDRLPATVRWPGRRPRRTRLAGSGEFNGIGCRVYVPA